MWFMEELEAMIKMADSPETSEIHKSLTAELARMVKTAKAQPNSVRLEKRVAWITREERRRTEALTVRRAANQEETKTVEALKQELVQNQTLDDPMGVAGLDEWERKELNILRELAVAASSPGSGAGSDKRGRLSLHEHGFFPREGVGKLSLGCCTVPCLRSVLN